MRETVNALTIAAGCTFVIVGAAALYAPAVLSHLYGLYTHERNGRGFVRATGARDLVLGGLLAYFAFSGQTGGTLALLIGGTALALADFAIVWRSNGRFERVLYVHLAGAAGLALLATFVGIGRPSR